MYTAILRVRKGVFFFHFAFSLVTGIVYDRKSRDEFARPTIVVRFYIEIHT